MHEEGLTNCCRLAHLLPQPVNSHLRPTTIFYADDSPGLTFSHELVFDVFFQRPGVGSEADDRLMVATMYKRDVTVAKCGPSEAVRNRSRSLTPASTFSRSSSCNFEALTLPVYSASAAD